MVRYALGGQGTHRALATTLQHRASTQLVGVRAPGTGNKQGWLKGYVNTNLNTGTYRGGRSQPLQRFQPAIDIMGKRDPAFCMRLYQHLLDCVASHRVANQPNRFEPQLRKRRPKHYGFLRKPRKQTKLDLVKGVR